jgi:NDP-sugar pyrophosphorylase family protein
MKAMIFAAGLGTRLFPLTQSKPKALIEIAGKTLLQRSLEKVCEAGISEIVINIHHFGEQIRNFLQRNDYFGLNISISDETDELLDTGGAILKAAPLLKGNVPVLVYNVDVLSSLNIQDLLSYHLKKGAMATLAIRERKTARYLMFDEEMQLGGWTNIATGQEKIVRQSKQLNPWAFSGIQILDPQILDLITETGKFSLVSLYLRLAEKYPIFGYPDSSSLWMDLGKPDQLKEAEKMLMC